MKKLMYFSPVPPRFMLCACMLAMMTVASASAADLQQVKVLGERVNLRTRAQQSAEVAGQVNAGDELTAVSMSADWVEVVAPDFVDAWVASEFVVEGTVVVNTLNARSGAGINHSVIGAYKKGDKVERRGSFGEWIKVPPPGDARLFVSRSLVEPVMPPAEPASAAPMPAEIEMDARPEPGIPATGEEMARTPFTPITDVPVAPQAPADLKLIPLDGQGRVVQREGLLKRTPGIFSKPPGSHRLVRRDGNKLTTVAYLRGNVSQLNSLLDQELLIRGEEYWAEDIKPPVMVIHSIEKRALY